MIDSLLASEYTLEGLEYGEYYWKVLAYDARGAMNWSTEVFSFTVSSPTLFVRGDANGDMGMTMGDAMRILEYMYVPGSPPVLCLDAADTDDNGSIEMGDALYVLQYLYIPDSPSPPLPFPDCGYDSSPDVLSCDEHPCGSRGSTYGGVKPETRVLQRSQRRVSGND
jgi:hypothetical protein